MGEGRKIEKVDIPTRSKGEVAASKEWNHILDRANEKKLTRREFGVQVFKMAKLVVGSAIASSLGNIYAINELAEYNNLSEQTGFKNHEQVLYNGNVGVIQAFLESPLKLRTDLETGEKVPYVRITLENIHDLNNPIERWVKTSEVAPLPPKE